jgi:hypothetical protein
MNTLKITISGNIKSGKTLMAAFIAEQLIDNGVLVDWKDGPVDDIGILASIQRKKRLLDDHGADIGDVVSRVVLETVQLAPWERP